MKQLFYKFLEDMGLSIEKMPNQATLVDLSIQFNRWANHRGGVNEETGEYTPPRSNRQGTSAFCIQKYIAATL